MNNSNLSFHDIRVALENKNYMSEDLLLKNKTSTAFARIWIQLKKILGYSKEYRIDQVSRSVIYQYNDFIKSNISSYTENNRNDFIKYIDEFQDMLMITRLLRKKLGSEKFLALTNEVILLNSDFLKEVEGSDYSPLDNIIPFAKNLEDLEKRVLDNPNFKSALLTEYASNRPDQL